MAHTLPKQEILRGYGVFARVLSQGATLSRSPVRLFYLFSSERETPVRVGFAVARAIRSAVERNRARRLLREAYRMHRDLLPPAGSRGGLELVLMYTGQAGVRPRLESVAVSVRRLFGEVPRA